MAPNFCFLSFAFFYRLKPKENPDAAGAAACTSALPLLALVSLNSFDSLACSSACKTTQARGRQVPGQLYSTSCGKPMWEPPSPTQHGNTNRTLRCFACRSASSACITSGFCCSRASTKRWCRFVLHVPGQAAEALDKTLVGNSSPKSSPGKEPLLVFQLQHTYTCLPDAAQCVCRAVTQQS